MPMEGIQNVLQYLARMQWQDYLDIIQLTGTTPTQFRKSLRNNHNI